jgi:hypothetical protein
MDETASKAMGAAVTRLRHAAGGSDPWTESCGAARCRGGFAWRDEAGNQFDIIISLIREAPRTPEQEEAARLRRGWQTTILGDDAAHSTNPNGWCFAEQCRMQSLMLEGEKIEGAREGGYRAP